MVQTNLVNLVRALDTSALEALASKGLLRRAQKDLERGVAVCLDREDKGALCLKVDQFEVSIPDSGPAKAKCSCPAAGVCQHILAAVLFLQRQEPDSGAAAPATATSTERELLSFTREQLEAWAGKATFRAALQLAVQSPAEIRSERGLVICFPALNAQCHCPPGGGLDGMIVSGNAKDERRIAVAAVLAFQRLKGVTWEEAAQASAPPEESAGAPRSRSEVLDVAQQLLIGMIECGLARVSATAQQRLATLAVSAVGVNLPRLSLMLRGLSDECSLVVARDARSDLGRLLVRAAYAQALCTALQQGGTAPRPDLVGWHRTRYEEIGHLDLVGVSAWPWRTASGYMGLTLLFWDAGANRWNSWSESRPSGQSRDFEPVARYTQPGPWEGADSPRQLARSRFRLMNARRNPASRLSGSSKSRVLVTGPVSLKELGLPVIEDWTRLLQPLEAQVSVGLKESQPLDSIFVLKPDAWAQRAFDEVAQRFVWVLLDLQQRPLPLVVAFDAFSEPAIRHLEKAAADAVEGALVVGRLQRTQNGLSLHPFSIHRRNGEISHLYLDTTVPRASGQSNPARGDDAEEIGAEEEEGEPVLAFSPFISKLLDEVDDALLALAESGIAALSPLQLERLRQMMSRAELLNLQVLAAGLNHVTARPQPSAILRCSYLSQLHRAAMPLAE